MAVVTSKKKLQRACRDELECLWSDLEIARHSAIFPGTWTIRCEQLEERIKILTRLVGPTEWGRVGIPLHELGIYQRIHADMGIEAPVDMEAVADIRRMIDARVPWPD